MARVLGKMPQKFPKNGPGNNFNFEADEYASITALRSCNLLKFAPLRLVCVCVWCVLRENFSRYLDARAAAEIF